MPLFILASGFGRLQAQPEASRKRASEAALFALRADFGPVFSQGRRAIAGGRRMGRFEGMRPSIPGDPNIAVHSGLPRAAHPDSLLSPFAGRR